MNNRRDIYDIETVTLPVSRERQAQADQQELQTQRHSKSTRIRKWVERWTTLARMAEKRSDDYLKQAEQYIQEDSMIATPSLKRVVYAISILFILYPAVAVFDYLIAPDVVEFLFNISEEGSMSFLWQLLAGLMILAIEIGFSAIREAIGEKSKVFYWILGVVYLGLACAMALLFRAIFVAGFSGLELDSSSVLLREGLSLLSFGAHAAILLGGRPALEAKELVMYRRLRFLHRWNRFKLIRRIRRVFSSFQKFLDVRGSGRITPEDACRFSIDAKRYINEAAGEDVFTIPADHHGGDGEVPHLA